jgi:hypothetical protein
MKDARKPEAGKETLLIVDEAQILNEHPLKRYGCC